MWDEKKLLEICEKYKNQAPENVMFPEPYLPYMPDKPKKWNGILVLAEAQNFSRGGKYYEWLDKLTSEERMTRLGRKPYEDKRIGVGPWDGKNGGEDEIFKFALRAIFEGANLDLKLEDVAVSNAVPWTKKRGGSKNENPDEYMKAKAKDFWKEIFEAWDPEIKVLVVLGDMAEEVMNSAGILKKYEGKWLKLRHPSRTNKVSYACQAVSLGVEKFKECFGT